MVELDRQFVVTEAHVERASKAAFVAWHHMARPWRRYAAYVLGGLIAVWISGQPAAAVLTPLAIGADVWTRYRAAVSDTRSQEPVGTAIALGFGEDAFTYRTWTQSGRVPYSAVQKVVASHGCLVIVALSEHIFWPLPADLIPPVARLRMSGDPT
jgi:hypothetical protein